MIAFTRAMSSSGRAARRLKNWPKRMNAWNAGHACSQRTRTTGARSRARRRVQARRKLLEAARGALDEFVMFGAGVLARAPSLNFGIFIMPDSGSIRPMGTPTAPGNYDKSKTLLRTSIVVLAIVAGVLAIGWWFIRKPHFDGKAPLSIAVLLHEPRAVNATSPPVVLSSVSITSE